MDKKRRRLPFISFSSAVLFCMVVLMITIGIIGTQRKTSYNEKHITLSRKALLDICTNVDYSETCRQHLPFQMFNTDHHPGDLMRLGFEAAMTKLKSAAEKAIAFQAEHADNYTKNALMGCSQLVDRAVNDLKRSQARFENRDINMLADIFDDVLTWVSGSLTYQQTCIDGFLDANGAPVGPIRENMKMALAKGMELTINALGMMTQLAPKNNVPTDAATTGQLRRLKSLERFPEGLDSRKRSLLQASPADIKADVIVAQDGSGKYKTINEAVKDIPLNGTNLFVIYIKEGVYNEKVTIEDAMMHVMMVGDGPTKTKITGAQNVVDGQTTFLSATVAIQGDFFIAKDIGFENTAGAAKNQAVALRVGADKSIIYNCRIDGFQDTLYTHTYRQFYRDCTISGTIDFVFGDAAAVFQNCTFLVRKPEASQACVVMAQSRINVRQPTGIVLQNCTIVEDPDPTLHPDKATVEVYLGRPWTEYSRTIIMESFIGDIIRAAGYTQWNGTFGLDTLFYAEAKNRGPGAAKDNRVKWKGIRELTDDQIQRFTPKPFIQGDSWIPDTKIPYTPGLMLPTGPEPSLAPTPTPGLDGAGPGPGPGPGPAPALAPGPDGAGGNEDIPFEDQRNCYHSHTNFTGNTCN